MTDVTRCRRCPRLVEWREEVGRTKRAAFAGEEYWARPLPSWGAPGAKVLMLGLAPAAHGANRTGRLFTGDRSGDFLFAGLHRTGFASAPSPVSRDDGLQLRDIWITAPVRCAPPANKPTPAERDACLPWTVAELRDLRDLRVCIALGAFAWDAALRLVRMLGFGVPAPRPRFGHAALAELEPWPLLGCFHVSQQNTFTGVLTPAMLDDVLLRARAIAELP